MKTKIISQFTLKRVFAVAVLAVMLFAGSIGMANAEPAPTSYQSDTKLVTGTIVQVNEKDSTKVIPATQKELDKMYGVIINPDSQAVTIAGDPNQVLVATSGKYDTLVTNENGSIKAGDTVTMSSLKGTAMKSSYKQRILYGKALESFDGKNNTIGSVTLKDTAGKDFQTVKLGKIMVAIDIRNNPEIESTKTNLPQKLERIGLAIADKPVSGVRLYLSMGIVLVTIITAIVVLYAGVRNSIISLGRNPLSKKSIFRGLLEIILVSFIVLIIGMAAVYLLLKL